MPSPSFPLLHLSIEPFQRGDAQLLISTIDKVCAGTLWMSDHYEATPDWEHALDNVSCPRHLLNAAKIEGQIVGWCRLFPTDNNLKSFELGIGVLPSCQRQGVGAVLLENAIIWAKSRPAASVTLNTHADNRPARALFERFAFTLRERRGEWLRMELNFY